MKQSPVLPLSIIIPTLDEAGNLNLLFDRIDKSLSKANIPYEIIIVDDYSTDETASIAYNAAPKYNVRFARKRGLRGKAFSLLEGFEMANYDLICMIDADLQYPPEAIPAMYRQLIKTDTDIIVTKRHSHKTSLLRRLSTLTYNFIFVRLLFGINYDTQSGLKLFKREVLQNINLTPSPWTFDLEFIIRALEQEYSISEHQISFSQRHAGVAKIKIISATIEMSRASLKLRRQTTSKLIKLNYDRNLQFLQRSSIWAIALLTAVIAAGVVPIGKANALSVTTTSTPSSVVYSLGQTINTLTTTGSTGSDSSSGASLPSISSVSMSGVSAATAPSSTTTTGTIAPAQTPATAPTTTDQTAAATPSKQSSSKVNITKDAALAPSTSSNSSSSTASDSHLGSVSTKNNSAYYNTGMLSGTKTQRLLKLALHLLEIGAGFILLSGIVLISKLLNKRQRQALRNYS